LKRRAVIFANGELRDAENIRKKLLPEDFLIAADGGQKHMQLLNMTPQLLIGDLDSLEEQTASQLQGGGTQLQRYPKEKNETDLELALIEARKRGYQQIILVAALGGRLDQTLGNLALAFHPDLKDCDLRMDDGVEEVFFPHSTLTLAGEPGDCVSLIAFGDPVMNIYITGFKYPFQGETLWPHQTRGISNEMLFDVGHIEFQRGKLIVIHTRSKMVDYLGISNCTEEENE